jgi:hypothetical protein
MWMPRQRGERWCSTSLEWCVLSVSFYRW